MYNFEEPTQAEREEDVALSKKYWKDTYLFENKRTANIRTRIKHKVKKNSQQMPAASRAPSQYSY